MESACRCASAGSAVQGSRVIMPVTDEVIGHYVLQMQMTGASGHG